MGPHADGLSRGGKVKGHERMTGQERKRTSGSQRQRRERRVHSKQQQSSGRAQALNLTHARLRPTAVVVAREGLRSGIGAGHGAAAARAAALRLAGTQHALVVAPLNLRACKCKVWRVSTAAAEAPAEASRCGRCLMPGTG